MHEVRVGYDKLHHPARLVGTAAEEVSDLRSFEWVSVYTYSQYMTSN